MNASGSMHKNGKWKACCGLRGWFCFHFLLQAKDDVGARVCVHDIAHLPDLELAKGLEKRRLDLILCKLPNVTCSMAKMCALG